MAVKSGGTGSEAAGWDDEAPAAPAAPGGGRGNPRPNGDSRPSGLNVISKSYSPSRPVLSTTFRPSCRRSMPMTTDNRVAVARTVMPLVPIMMKAEPRGGGLPGPKGKPRPPGSGGGPVADVGSQGPGSTIGGAEGV